MRLRADFVLVASLHECRERAAAFGTHLREREMPCAAFVAEMLEAAIKKAVEAGLLPRRACREDSSFDRDLIRLVLQAAFVFLSVFGNRMVIRYRLFIRAGILVRQGVVVGGRFRRNLVVVE